MMEKVSTLINKFKSQYWPNLRDFWLLYRHECKRDNVAVSAGYLSYVSLLSFVPLVAVMFSVIAAFPMFTGVKEKVQGFVFDNFLPASSEVISQHVNEFAANATGMTAIGVLSLVVVALLLISAIDTTLNRIWKTKEKRRLVTSFSIYWMVLTLGPVLIGASLAASSYLLSLAAFAEEYTPGLTELILKFFPFFSSAFAFLLLYMLVPNREVRWQDAALGAIIAAILFELTKRGFAIYVTNFPSYQAIYGALAAIPILFVWVYLSWVVVLFGAEFTHCLELYRKQADSGPEHSTNSSAAAIESP